jgi:hypothetical protein
MLFNIVSDMLAIMIECAKNDGLIEGVIHHLVDGGLSILQYADDTILLTEYDLEKAQNLVILSAFEQLSGLKINFHKSALFSFGEAQDEVNAYTDLSGTFSYEVSGDSDSLSEINTCRMEAHRGETAKMP